MKKLLLSALLLTFILHAHAQESNRIPVLIKLGKMAPPEVIDGKVAAIYTTRTEILKHTMLISTASNCEVTSYSFAIKAEGHELTGPFEIKGAALPEKIKNKIREWDYPGTQVMIRNIHVSCDGKDHVAYSLFLNYDH